ncbi:MAG: hypothetical protein IJQ80_08175, partial [Clostridia bacterium]|nr:hypothetical protein [Clostridia bacterium]
MRKASKTLLSLLLVVMLIAGFIPYNGFITKAEAASAGDGATYEYVLTSTLTAGKTYLIASGGSGAVTLAGVASGTEEGGALAYTSVSSNGTVAGFAGAENYEWTVLPSRSAGIGNGYSTPVTFVIQNEATGAYLYNPVYENGEGSDMRITYDPLNDTYPQSTRQVFNSTQAYNAYVTTNSTGSAVQDANWVTVGRSGAADPNVMFNFRVKDSATTNGLTGFHKGAFIAYNAGGVTKMAYYEVFPNNTFEGRESINLTGGTGVGGLTTYRQAKNTWAFQVIPDFLYNWGGSSGVGGVSATTSTEFTNKTLEQIRFDIDCDQHLYIPSVFLAYNDHARTALQFYRLNESKFGTNGYYPSQRFPFCQFCISADGQAKQIGNFDTNRNYYTQMYSYGWSGGEFSRFWNQNTLTRNTYFYEKRLVSEQDYTWSLVTSASELSSGDLVMIASTNSNTNSASVLTIGSSGAVAASSGNSVASSRLTLGAGTSSADAVMRVCEVGESGEFFLISEAYHKYLRTNVSHDGFETWEQLSEGGAFGTYYGVGIRCSYNAGSLVISSNPQNSGESAVATTLGIADGASAPSTSGTSYIYKKAYHVHTPLDAGTVTLLPTCAEEGARTYTCASCGLTYTEAIPKDPTNHTDLRAVAAADPTCTETGCIAHGYCSGCGCYYTDASGTTATTLDAVTINPLGHSYVGVTTAPN